MSVLQSNLLSGFYKARTGYQGSANGFVVPEESTRADVVKEMKECHGFKPIVPK